MSFRATSFLIFLGADLCGSLKHFCSKQKFIAVIEGLKRLKLMAKSLLRAHQAIRRDEVLGL